MAQIMSMQNNPQTTSASGKWLFFNEATVATNKSEKTLKRYIKKGDLKWRRLGKQVNSPVQIWITAEFLATIRGESEQKLDDLEIFEVEPQEVDGWPESESDETTPAPDSSSAEDPYQRMIKTLVGEFAVQLDRQREAVDELRKELQDKNTQLRLLPDLQRQAELERKSAEQERKTAELKELEIIALKQQIAAIEQEKDQQLQTVKEQIEILSQQINSAQKVSWFKKWFLPRQD